MNTTSETSGASVQPAAAFGFRQRTWANPLGADRREPAASSPSSFLSDSPWGDQPDVRLQPAIDAHVLRSDSPMGATSEVSEFRKACTEPDVHLSSSAKVSPETPGVPRNAPSHGAS